MNFNTQKSGVRIGQRKQLSKLDALKINRMYCPEKESTMPTTTTTTTPKTIEFTMNTRPKYFPVKFRSRFESKNRFAQKDKPEKSQFRSFNSIDGNEEGNELDRDFGDYKNKFMKFGYQLVD